MTTAPCALAFSTAATTSCVVPVTEDSTITVSLPMRRLPVVLYSAAFCAMISMPLYSCTWF